MRKAFSNQTRFDCQCVLDVELNLNCRDEIIPILRALQYIYSRPAVRDEILELIAQDVNPETRKDWGREGLDYWHIMVLASVRLGCNLDYDKLQDLAEQHRALRHVMGIGDWDVATQFGFRRIRENLRLLEPETIEKISYLVVGLGHELAPEAAEKTRADSFVIETNIHYPAESEMLVDGVRLILKLSLRLGFDGWRQHGHLLKKMKRMARHIGTISSRKGPNYKQRLRAPYRKLLKLSRKILRRAQFCCEELEGGSPSPIELARIEKLKMYVALTKQIWSNAKRRVLKGEKVPNSEKVFSIFEPHTQLYKRGKASKPLQWGRLVMVYEDAAGFITHHYVLSRDEQDADVVVEQTRIVQERLDGRIQIASFDCGFHTPDNQVKLAEIIKHPCLPKKGSKQSANQEATASITFREARRRHPGVESAIGALQSGNGLRRSRDRSELGLKRYVALGILGRNLHQLGKLVIAKETPDCQAAHSKCKPAA